MILVTGGTGRLGTLVVTGLAARGLDVRVFTRDAARAERLTGIATSVVVGDVRNRASIDAAMRDVTTVVSAVHGFVGPGRVTPDSVDRHGNANLIDAAVTVGADVVLMSTVGAASDSPFELFRAKHDAEQHLRASSVPWTIVRATAFVELWAEIMAKPIVFGRGDNPINFVSVRDVAAVVERAVVEVPLRGQILEVGGPRNLTFNELAALLAEVRGRDTKVWHVPRPVLRAMAPLVRPVRAALAMDTTDMSFDASAHRSSLDGIPITDLRTALQMAANGPQPDRAAS
jgi:NADH dehydrogenase